MLKESSSQELLRPISTKLGRKHAWRIGILKCSNKWNVYGKNQVSNTGPSGLLFTGPNVVTVGMDHLYVRRRSIQV